VRGKAEQFGVKEIYIDDLREEFVRDFVFPMFRCAQAEPVEFAFATFVARPPVCWARWECSSALLHPAGRNAVCTATVQHCPNR